MTDRDRSVILPDIFANNDGVICRKFVLNCMKKKFWQRNDFILCDKFGAIILIISNHMFEYFFYAIPAIHDKIIGKIVIQISHSLSQSL